MTTPSNSQIANSLLQIFTRNCKVNNQLNYGVIHGFPALRKAVITHVKKYDILSRVFIIAADASLAFRDTRSG